MYGAEVPIYAALEQKRKKEYDEEEKMTHYSKSDLEGDWEFKIVRSSFGSFRKPHKLQSLIEEEAQAGWEMVEKFDDNRIRFKRPRSARENDATLPGYIDPYRTQYDGLGGQSALRVGILILAALMAGGMVVFLLLFGS